MISELLLLSSFNNTRLNEPATTNPNKTDFNTNTSTAASSSNSIIPSLLKSRAKKRVQVSKNDPEKSFAMFLNRFKKPRCLHVAVPSPDGTRGRCIWCKIVYAEKVGNEIVGNYQNEVKKTRKICAMCSSREHNCFLCEAHFELFHEYSVFL